MEGILIVTYRCNARCHMCNIWQYPTKPEEELDPKYYEKIPHVKFLTITGGEPFLMRYNPPFTPGFLRRNEIGIEIGP